MNPYLGEFLGTMILLLMGGGVNAGVLLQARTLGEPEGLSDEEIRRAAETQFSPLALDRAWEHFCLRAGVDPV